MGEEEREALAKKMLGKTATQTQELIAKHAEENGLNGIEEMQKSLKALSENDAELKALFGDKKGAEYIGEMQKQIDKVATDLKTAGAGVQTVKSMGGLIQDAIEEKSYQEFANKITNASTTGQKKGEHTFDLDLKAVTSLTVATATPNIVAGSRIPRGTYVPGVFEEARRRPFLENIISKYRTDSDKVYYIEKVNDEGDAIFVDEEEAYSKGDFDLEEKDIKVKHVGHYMKISNRMLADIPYMQSLIMGELKYRVDIKVDNNILVGDGTAKDMNGIKDKATAFSNVFGGVTKTYAAPNLADVVTVAKTQIEYAHHTPDTLIVNPVNLMDLRMLKDTTGLPIFPMGQPITSIEGLSVQMNTGVPVGEYFALDSRAVELYDREVLEVRIWDQNEDDAIKDMKTITASRRLGLLIKDSNAKAIVKGVWATDLTTITTV